MSMQLVTPSGDAATTSSVTPEEFIELREAFEKKLELLLNQFANAIRTSPAVNADVETLRASFAQRWQAECEVATRKGISLNTEAFTDQVNDLLAREERKRMYKGPITREALELVGFRAWPDGTMRTAEVTVAPVGDDWRIVITADLVNKHHMPYLLNLVTAAGIKSLTPMHPFEGASQDQTQA